MSFRVPLWTRVILKENELFLKIRIYSYLYNQAIPLNPTDKLKLKVVWNQYHDHYQVWGQ